MTAERKKIVEIGLLFTVSYAVCMGVCAFFFLRAGKSLICEADALEQHINALIAYGKWIRGILYTLVHEHRLAFQNYSFGIGLGADFYTSMQYYAVGDPLNLPVAFLPSRAVYYWFQFLILFRPWLAGISFLLLGRYRSRRMPVSGTGLAAGALLYSFSGTVLFIGMWNPFFVTPMITMPLLILGVDRLLLERKSTPFVAAVALAAVSNFYFFYMQVIFLFGYFALRMLFDRKLIGEAVTFREAGRQNGARMMLPCFLRFFFSGACGVMIGAVLLFPMFLALLGNPRVGGHALPLLYEAGYYRELIRNLAFYIYHPLYDTELSLTLLAWPVLVLTLFLAGRWGLRRERAELVLLILMLLIPAAGFVMSGFAYAINRWCWAFALLIAWLTAAEWDRLLRKQWLSRSVYALAFLLVLVNVYLADAPEQGNLPNGFADRSTGQAFLDRMTLTEMTALEETVLPSADTFARLGGRNLTWNTSLLHGISSTQFYWSLANGAVADFFSELAVNDMANYCYLGFEDRMTADEVAGVTHYTLRYDTPEEEAYVPAGFVRAAEYYNYAIYENTLPVGLGTVYAETLPRGEYLSLSPRDREEAMLYAAVLSDEDTDRAVSRGAKMLHSDGIPEIWRQTAWEISFEEDVFWIPSQDGGSGGTFLVTGENGGRVCLSFDDGSDGETEEMGLFLRGLRVEGPRDIVNIGVTATPAPDASDSGEAEAAGIIRRTISYKTPESEFYSGWHDYEVNFGSGRAPFHSVLIEFPAPGRYMVDDMEILSRAVDGEYFALRETLSARAVQETDLHRNPVSLMTDTVTFVASCADGEQGVLVLTIPWQRGWQAFVDGERKEMMRANTAFMGLLLEPGYHEITLHYQTPGLGVGAVISLAGLAVFVLLMIREWHGPGRGGNENVTADANRRTEKGEADDEKQ